MYRYYLTVPRVIRAYLSIPVEKGRYVSPKPSHYVRKSGKWGVYKPFHANFLPSSLENFVSFGQQLSVEYKRPVGVGSLFL